MYKLMRMMMLDVHDLGDFLYDVSRVINKHLLYMYT